MKRLYLFDCFGVVVSDVSALWMDRHCTEEQKQFIRKEIFRKVDVGAMSHDEMYEQLAAQCGVSKQAVIDEWEQIICVKSDTVELIKRLRQQGQVVALLSNASVQYIDYLFTKFDLYKHFDKIFVSARYGYAKPDRELYQICLDSFEEKFEKIYFTDDNFVNLQNLEELGITAVLFKSAEQFEVDTKQ